MKKTAICLMGLALLAGCSSQSRTKLGLVKEAPDEFMIISRAPLSLPPDYNLLPVNEGMVNAKEVTELNRFDGMTEGEKRMMKKIEAQKSEANIKDIIEKENKEINE